jgi:hypothetical protein
VSGSIDTPYFFDANLPRGRGSWQRSDGRPARAADVPGGSGLAVRRALAHAKSRTKGGISAMAKKTAKGGKKKGGKKR